MIFDNNNNNNNIQNNIMSEQNNIMSEHLSSREPRGLVSTKTLRQTFWSRLGQQMGICPTRHWLSDDDRLADAVG